VDGARNLAQFNNCAGIAIDKEGHLYVADGGNHKIRKITAQGYVISNFFYTIVHIYSQQEA